MMIRYQTSPKGISVYVCVCVCTSCVRKKEQTRRIIVVNGQCPVPEEQYPVPNVTLTKNRDGARIYSRRDGGYGEQAREENGQRDGKGGGDSARPERTE
jgi:hypothetical protein